MTGRGMTGRPLVLSQGTFLNHSTEEFLDACAGSGLSAGLWRTCYDDMGAEKVRALAAERDVELVSLSRVGFFTAPDQDAQLRDNLVVLDDAAMLGIDTVVVVSGAVKSSFADGDRAVRAGIEQLVPHAEERGVRLALEPFHPMMAAERSCIVRLSQAVDIVEQIDSPSLGVALDSYHVWWEPDLAGEILRARPYIMLVHIADWLVPTIDLLRGRGVPGEGVIDLRRFMMLVAEAGYEGRIEIEVLSNVLAVEEPVVVAQRLRAATESILDGLTLGRPSTPLETA